MTDTPAHARATGYEPLVQPCYIGQRLDTCNDSIPGIDVGLDPVSNIMNQIPPHCWEIRHELTPVQIDRLIANYEQFRHQTSTSLCLNNTCESDSDCPCSTQYCDDGICQCKTSGPCIAGGPEPECIAQNEPCHDDNNTTPCCEGLLCAGLDNNATTCLNATVCQRAQQYCNAVIACCPGLECQLDISTCTEQPSPSCVAEGLPCQPDECCDGLVCFGAGIASICQVPPGCVDNDHSCTGNLECCSGYCNPELNSTCQPPECQKDGDLCSPLSTCCPGLTCTQNGAVERCVNETDTELCTSVGDTCSNDDECCDDHMCVKTYAGHVCHEPCCDSTFCFSRGIPRCDLGCSFRGWACSVNADCCGHMQCQETVCQ